MSTWYGWAGTILNVDLTNMKVSREPLDKEFAAKYIGGSGFGARILYDEVGPGDNALEPENVIIITQGPLNATAAPSGGRFDLISKSPLTGIYCRSNGGGSFGPELKWAGYDLIIVRGKAEKPVYLWIDDDLVELRDATHLWGKDTWTTQRMLEQELGDPDIKVLKIGPAGENLGYSACVITGLTHAAGTGGFGMVWGSKKLKAVAVRGSKGVNIARPKEFLEICQSMRERIKNDPLYSTYTTGGCIAVVSDPVVSKGEYGKTISTLHSSNFSTIFDKNLACFGCGLRCSHYYTIKTGKYKGTAAEGVEGQHVITALTLSVGDPAFVCKYADLCNKLGLHTRTPGDALAWAMDLYRDGIITKEDTDGLELTPGNEEAFLKFVEKIAYKEGFGEILDAFPIRAAQMLGRGSEQYISPMKGIDRNTVAVICQAHIHIALGYSVSVRGVDHLMGAPQRTRLHFREQITDEHLEKVGRERYNNPREFLEPYVPSPGKARHVYDLENICALCDMTGTCKFASEWGCLIEGTHIEDFARLLSAATGIDYSPADVTKAAERELLLERSFNAREGIRRADDYPFPYAYQLKYGKQHPRYNYSKFKFSLEDYTKILDEFYKLRGCDLETGIPTREKLESLTLKDVADDLERRGIAPPSHRKRRK